MWICPTCKTRNSDAFCVNCGCPAPDAKPAKPAKPAAKPVAPGKGTVVTIGDFIAAILSIGAALIMLFSPLAKIGNTIIDYVADLSGIDYGSEMSLSISGLSGIFSKVKEALEEVAALTSSFSYSMDDEEFELFSTVSNYVSLGQTVLIIIQVLLYAAIVALIVSFFFKPRALGTAGRAAITLSTVIILVSLLVASAGIKAYIEDKLSGYNGWITSDTVMGGINSIITVLFVPGVISLVLCVVGFILPAVVKKRLYAIGGESAYYTPAVSAPAPKPVAPVAATPVYDDGSWVCACGTRNKGKFCVKCGNTKPTPAAPVSAPAVAPKITPAAPAPKPAAPAYDDGSWVCACGTRNKGNFCVKCGNTKPTPAVPAYAPVTTPKTTPVTPASAPVMTPKTTPVTPASAPVTTRKITPVAPTPAAKAEEPKNLFHTPGDL